MASTRFEAACCLCCAVLSASNKRRRLYSPSSEHVLMQLKELAVHSGYCVSGAYSILPAESAEAFLCLGCFASVQKIVNLRKVEGEIQTRLRQLATDRGVQPCSSGQLGTPAARTSEKPQETPRKRRLEEEEVGTPKAKRRRGVSTPVRRAVELTHVEGSPAELPIMDPEENEAYLRLLQDLQKHIPLLSGMLSRLDKQPTEDNKRNDQYVKLRSLFNLLQDHSKRVPLTTLQKCAQLLEKISDQDRNKNREALDAPPTPVSQAPTSSSSEVDAPYRRSSRLRKPANYHHS